MNPAIPTANQIAILDAITDVAGIFGGAKMMLFKNDYTPSRDSLLADLTAADFTGYALSAAIVWDAAHLDLDKNPIVTGPVVNFTAGAIGTANDIYGYGIVNAAGNALLWAKRFEDAPIPITVQGQVLPVLPLLTLGTPPDLGPNGMH